jgi:hypothetical protein
MKRLGKVAVVLGGYAGALVAANVAVAIWQRRISAAEAQASAGMYAFGDFLFFCEVFGLLALVPTGFALHFLRPFGRFWTALSVASLTIAATSPAAVVLVALGRAGWLGSGSLYLAGGFGVLRLIAAPALAVAFAVFAAFAPGRRPRLALFAAAALEAVACAYDVIGMIMMRAS